MPFPSADQEPRIGIVAETNPAEPLLESEIRDKLSAILREKGYRPVGPDQAEFLLVATATVDAGRPELDYVPVTSGGGWYPSYAVDSCGRAVTVTTYVPGSTSYVPYEYTVFTKGLAVSLLKREFMVPPPNDGGREDYADATVWRCVVLSTGTSTDLRWLVNHMLLAAFDRFGEDTGRQVHVRMDLNDDRVRLLARDGLYEEED